MEKVKVAPSRVSIFENVTVTATLVAEESSLDGVLVVYYDGDPQQGGEAFDAELIPHIRANDAYVNRVKFRPRTCGPHTVFVVAQSTATGTATVTVDCPPGTAIRGKAERVGGGAEKGKVSFSGKVPAAGTLDLRVATVTVTALLREIGGGELVRGGGGAAVSAGDSQGSPGQQGYRGDLRDPAGVRPSVEIEVKQRDPKKGEVEFSLKVDRATIPLAPKGCDPRGERRAAEDKHCHRGQQSEGAGGEPRVVLAVRQERAQNPVTGRLWGRGVRRTSATGGATCGRSSASRDRGDDAGTSGSRASWSALPS